LSAAAPAGPRSRLSILLFHRVQAQPDPLFPLEVTADGFDAVLGLVRKWFNVLPLHEATERLQRGSLPARPACITFDDGYADNCTHALPVLQRHGIHATFFIATGFLDGGCMWNDSLIEALRNFEGESLDLRSLELDVFPTGTLAEKRTAISALLRALKHRPDRSSAVEVVLERCNAKRPTGLMLTSQQLRALRAAGMGIGAHTVNHPILTRLDAATARREIADSRDHLEALLGERISFFAYPNGRRDDDYSEEHSRMVADIGFAAALSTNAGASKRGDDLFQLRRFTPWTPAPLRFGLAMLGNLRRS
jgi:peptidoglycan/xylan/chitin deacetylase (PgdA/CDA1 family)